MVAQWTPPDFRGNPFVEVDSIDVSGGIASFATSGDAPFAARVSASAITAVGTNRPYEDLEFYWDFGVDSADAEEVWDPTIGKTTRAHKQYGPEACYLYRTPGQYTITLTVRGKSSGGAEFISETTTLDVTVSEYAPDYIQWIDPDTGDDANDGFDPWGFALTGASYDDGTKRLTATGAFAGYDHAAATEPEPDDEKYNVIYLTGGTGITTGLYTIASKIDDDTIELSSSAGSTASDVTSSDGPWANKIDEFDKDNERIKRGTTVELSARLDSLRHYSNYRITPYGTGAKPVIKMEDGHATSRIMYWNVNGESPANHYFRDIVFDQNETQSNAVRCFVNSGTIKNLLFDGVEFINQSNNSSASQVQMGTGSEAGTGGFTFWNCHWKGGAQAGEHGYLGAVPWLAIFGGSFKGKGSDDLLHHHIYPSTDDHQMYKFIDFKDGPDRNYCINSNATSTSGERTRYWYVARCKMSGTLRGLDASTTNNNRTDDGAFEFFVAEENTFNDLGRAAVHYFCADTMAIRNNLVWGTFEYFLWIMDPESAFQAYGNKVYLDRGSTMTGLRVDPANNEGWMLKGNELWFESVTGDLRLIRVPFANLSAGQVNENQYHYPNVTDQAVFIDHDQTGGKTFSQWQADLSQDANSTVGSFDWNDPANGDFRVTAEIGGTQAVVIPPTAAGLLYLPGGKLAYVGASGQNQVLHYDPE